VSKSGDLSRAKEWVFCNFDFLQTKLLSFSVNEVLLDFDLAISLFPEDEELSLILDTLRLSASTLSSNPFLLASELIGRLLGFRGSFSGIANLIEGAQKHAKSNYLLAPSLPSFTPPGGPVRTILKMTESRGEVSLLSFSPDASFLVTCYSAGRGRLRRGSGGTQVWNPKTGTLLYSIENFCPKEIIFLPNRSAFLGISPAPGFFDLPTGEVILELEGAEMLEIAMEDNLVVTHDGAKAFLVCNRSEVGMQLACWDLSTGKLSLLGLEERRLGQEEFKIAVSPCDRWLGLSTLSSLLLFDLSTQERVFRCQLPVKSNFNLEFMNDKLLVYNFFSHMILNCASRSVVRAFDVFDESEWRSLCPFPWVVKEKEREGLLLFQNLWDPYHTVSISTQVRKPKGLFGPLPFLFWTTKDVVLVSQPQGYTAFDLSRDGKELFTVTSPQGDFLRATFLPHKNILLASLSDSSVLVLDTKNLRSECLSISPFFPITLPD